MSSLPLPFDDRPLFPVSRRDRAARELADRHYSRRTVGADQFIYAGRAIVLRDAARSAVFAWLHPLDEFRDDGRFGFHNVLFRNEGPRRSSDLILDAELWALELWGPGQAWTFVDPRHVRRSESRLLLQGGGLAIRGVHRRE